MANGEAILRGFDMMVPDVGDQLHFRPPLLSFRGGSDVYVARRVDWQDDRQALAIVDDPEELELATLLADDVDRPIASGQGVVVAGAGFFHAASLVGGQLHGFSRHSEADCDCWLRVATHAEFVALKVELIDESKRMFDRELGRASRQGCRLTEQGDAAVLVLSRCGPLRQEDLAIRQLAAAMQNRESDLYRRLLARFELELGEPEDCLHGRAKRHIELVEAPAGTYGRWSSTASGQTGTSVQRSPTLREAPRLTDLRGSADGCYGDVAAFVRGLRDEWP